MSIIETIAEKLGLPAAFVHTPSGKKLLDELQDGERKAAAAAVETRRRLAAEYVAAVNAEKNDKELQALIKARKEFMVRSKTPKTCIIRREALPELRRMASAISRRATQHRERVSLLAAELQASAPPEIAAFMCELTALNTQTAAADTAKFNQKFIGGMIGDIGMFEYSTLRPSQVARMEAIQNAMGAARRLGFEALTAAELESRFTAIREGIPALTPTRFKRRNDDSFAAA